MPGHVPDFRFETRFRFDAPDCVSEEHIMEAWKNLPLKKMGTCAISALCILLIAGCNLTSLFSTCHTDADCEDGIFCNGVARCIQGYFLQGLICITLESCDGEPLVCDEETRSCLPCTLDEQCDDGIACTDDTCDVGLGHCSHDYDDSNCQMGYLCGVEGCYLGECRDPGDCSAPTPFCVLGPNGPRCVSEIPLCRDSPSCAKQMPDGRGR